LRIEGVYCSERWGLSFSFRVVSSLYERLTFKKLCYKSTFLSKGYPTQEIFSRTSGNNFTKKGNNFELIGVFIVSSENDVFMLGGVAPYMNVSFGKRSSYDL